MNTTSRSINGVCFGEILWDNLPTGKQIGGAPFNVAYHLNTLGITTKLITRVGDDQNGRELKEACASFAIPADLFQTDREFPTSTVEVMLDAVGNVSYEITYPVAWDFITYGQNEMKHVRAADFLVFGSLALRNTVSYLTLQALVKEAKYVVMDVNLRAPFYRKEQIFELLKFAHLVKMNEEELSLIAAWLLIPADMSDQSRTEHIMRNFDIDELIVTYGAAGSRYHSQTKKMSYYSAALKVNVVDTIGSGDSFLAAFLYKKFQQNQPQMEGDCLAFATTVSAFVTQCKGACPAYNRLAIQRFEWKKSTYKE